MTRPAFEPHETTPETEGTRRPRPDRRQSAPVLALALLLHAAALGCSESEVGPAERGKADRADAGSDAQALDAGRGASPDSTQDAVTKAVTRAFATAVDEDFSGVALVRHQGRTLLHEAAGVASRAASREVVVGTPFDIGSVTKQFTAAGVLKLVEQRALALDDTLADFFDEVPNDKADITVHQLLTHTAGLPDAVGDDDEAVGREEYLERVFQRELFYEPGTVHYYSNAGYSLLAAIIEQVTGQAYEVFLHEALFEPAGMRHTGYLLPAWEEPPAVGYRGRRIDAPLRRPHDDSGYTWNLRGNGGMLSTAEDMQRWHDALGTGEVLRDELVALMQTPHADEGIGRTFYGYGWVVEPTAAGPLVWHDGGNDYFFAQVLRYLEADLQVITLSNESSEVAESLARALASTVLPELIDDEVEWDLLFERGQVFEESSEAHVETVTVSSGEEHIAGFGAFLESGRLDVRVVDPDGEAFFSDHVSAGEYRERIFAIDERDGTWRMELELSNATGDLFFAWARRLE